MGLLTPSRRYDSVLDLVGRTPVIRIGRARTSKMATLWAKLEGSNPSGGGRDRVAAYIVAQAEADGRLRPGRGGVVEATAGQMGLSLAMVCAARGHALTLVMPDSVPASWTRLLSTFGAQCELTPAESGMAGARQRAVELAAERPGALLVDQFANPYNPDAHRHATAEELLADFRDLTLGGVVVPVGTGGTITGIAPVLRRRWPKIQIWAVEPAASPVLSGGEPGQHGIPGIGADFVPPVLDPNAYDAVELVEGRHAWEAARALARAEGMMVDPAGGAAFVAARKLSLKLGPDAHVVFVCPAEGRQTLAVSP